MNIHRIIKSGILTLSAILCTQPVCRAFYYAGHLADSYYVTAGETLEVSHCIGALPASGMAVSATQLKLFGIFPVKEVAVQPSEEVMLVPCGQPFGMRMLMDGIMVIGFGEVEAETGGCCPAVSAGIREGDMITAVNHEALTCAQDFRTLVTESGGDTLELTVQRDNLSLELTLSPAYSLTADCWQTGIWVRDSTAGIGTMTYYNPSDGSFGGLGHPICDPDTGEIIPLGKGTADAVTISGAVRGQAGSPGQLQGYFSAESPIGVLDSNQEAGIFGHLQEPVTTFPAVPMALKQEITLGEAVILTTVQGSEPRPYTAEITAIDYTDSTQNMIIKITDEELLACTGGIVQGMSGSPILQNGKLIGAVTHVFVSEPSTGYAIFAESMYHHQD
ncbi:MAG: SpoIVB peptidase [Oscillospiraceae bacterium]|nr:SpoIVB peptidase [Oscillospiraceae bacterium]